MASIIVNRAPVLALWATIVAERRFSSRDTTLTLGRALAGSAACIKAGSIGRGERKADRDVEITRLQEEHATKPVMLLGKEIHPLPIDKDELRIADGDQPANPAAVQRHVATTWRMCGRPRRIWRDDMNQPS